MFTGNAICMLVGTPTRAWMAITLIVAKPIVAAGFSAVVT
jgi:hypothetical protein